MVVVEKAWNCIRDLARSFDLCFHDTQRDNTRIAIAASHRLYRVGTILAHRQEWIMEVYV